MLFYRVKKKESKAFLLFMLFNILIGQLHITEAYPTFFSHKLGDDKVKNRGQHEHQKNYARYA